MKKLTNNEKDAVKIACNLLFNKVQKSDCKTIISALDKLEIDTTEMKSDFEFEFKQPYKL